ncbi:TonB-dependent receptor [soil metagenome]
MKFLFLIPYFLILSIPAVSQEIPNDTTTTREVLDEVLVRAVRVNANSPVTHSNLSQDELEKRNLGQDLPFMLGFLPSVVSTSDAGAGIGYTSFRVRGSDASRINVTLNGIPFNDAESQGSFFVNLPDFTSSVQNLQLQRGVGTSTNGSSAFGASLNLLTDAVSVLPYGEITNSFGSFNSRRHNIKFSTGLLNNRIELAGRLSAIASDGYVDRASSNLKSYFLQGAYLDDNTLIKAIMFGGHEITYQAWNGIDAETLAQDRTFNSAGMFTDASGNVRFHDNEVDDYRQDHYQLHWNQRYNNKWSSNLGLNYTYGRGFFEQYKENQKFSTYGFTPVEIGGEAINRTDLIRRRWLDNDFYVVNANVTYKTPALEVTSGAFYSHYTGDHFGEVIWARFASDSETGDRYYFSDASKDEFSLFTKTTYRLDDQWQIFGDLQGRFINYQTGGITSDIVPIDVNQDFSFFNPKAGVSYQLNDRNQFFGYYGKAHREPTRNDFEEGINIPEKLDDFEVGWRYNSERLKLNTNVYYMDYEDQLVLSGELNDVGAPLRTTSGSSYRVGLEIDAEITLTPQFILRPNLGLSSNKNRAFVTSIDGNLVNLGESNISFSPEVVASNMLLYRPLENLELGLLSKYVGEQYMGNIDSPASLLDSYFINDFSIYYEVRNIPVFRSIVFTGLVNNIFNVKYESNGYFYTFDDDFSNPGSITTIEGAGYYPQAGTNFLAGISLKF